MTTVDRLHSADSAAALLSVRPSTIRWWWTIGKLQRVKIGAINAGPRTELIEPQLKDGLTNGH
jgi:hypothetical protein